MNTRKLPLLGLLTTAMLLACSKTESNYEEVPVDTGAAAPAPAPTPTADTTAFDTTYTPADSAPADGKPKKPKL